MESSGKPTRTRVFRAGNSRAVRIPKAFDLPEGEVYIEQRDGGLFISALRGRWDLFFSQPGVEFPFTSEELRHQGPHREVDLSFLTGKRQAAARKKTRRATRARKS